MYDFYNNLVKKVSYRENIVLIEFNEYMHIEKKEHSYLNMCNYLLKINDRYFHIPKSSKIEVAEKGFIIRIIFPKTYANKLFLIGSIYLGYVCRNKFFYIESFKGTIQNIEMAIYLGREIKTLNIEQGITEIIDNNILKYTYQGENRFQEVYASDFYVEKLNSKYFPNKLKREENKIVFNFEEDIFEEFDNSLTLNIIKTPKSKDIYKLLIKENCSLKIEDTKSTYVNSLSFCDYKDNIGYFKICFSAPLSSFSDDDFLVEHNDILYKCFYENINKEKKVVEVNVSNLDISDVLKSQFKLILLNNVNNKIKTLDYKNKEVKIKDEVISKTFISENIDWNKVDNKLSKSIIKISFQNNIIPESIITNSEFNENLKPWNGNDITIPPKSLIMENKNSLTTITLKNNKSFGKISIKPREYLNFIKETTYNELDCFLSLNNKEITIKFDENEKNQVEFLSMESISYSPGKNIKDLNNNFIFSAFCPIKYEELSSVIYIEPLKEEEDNPFNGQFKNNSFVIKVNNENTFRNYGYENITTTIDGFLKIVGNLSTNQSILIKNIKVLGNIYLNIGESNIVFNGVECNNIINE